MKAVIVDGSGGADKLRYTDMDKPTAGAGQVLIRVHASGLNGADFLQREGNYSPPEGRPLIWLRIAKP